MAAVPPWPGDLCRRSRAPLGGSPSGARGPIPACRTPDNWAGNWPPVSEGRRRRERSCSTATTPEAHPLRRREHPRLDPRDRFHHAQDPAITCLPRRGAASGHPRALRAADGELGAGCSLACVPYDGFGLRTARRACPAAPPARGRRHPSPTAACPMAATFSTHLDGFGFVLLGLARRPPTRPQGLRLLTLDPPASEALRDRYLGRARARALPDPAPTSMLQRAGSACDAEKLSRALDRALGGTTTVSEVGRWSRT